MMSDTASCADWRPKGGCTRHAHEGVCGVGGDALCGLGAMCTDVVGRLMVNRDAALCRQEAPAPSAETFGVAFPES